MRKKIINCCLKKVQENRSYSNEELEILEYGLVSIYLLITKLVIILALCFILGILKETIIFMIFYNIIRLPSFGFHAPKSWICLVMSSIIFICIPFLIKFINLSLLLKSVIGILGIIFMYLFSPADTVKRPIINKRRREIYKLLSILITILYSFISVFINNNFLANCLCFSILLQCFIISPLIYKLFNMPYNNYKNYLLNEV